ncbi:hypothetical protein [Archangium violaceum]|uniref:hypothetical protein n=1 Tax=Archangium violaceum TaxID=83451 RepID=UPI001F324B9D|nr:hypothetical protein [Archangium violaceum]
MLKLVAPVASQFSVVPSPTLIVDAAAVKTWIVGGGGFVTVTTDSAYRAVSATLVARTLYIPSCLGAVNSPAWLISPPVAVQVTDVSLAPVTVAVKRCVPAMGSVTAAGSNATDTWGPVPPPPPGSQPSRANKGSISTRELEFRHIMGLRFRRGCTRGGACRRHFLMSSHPDEARPLRAEIDNIPARTP